MATATAKRAAPKKAATPITITLPVLGKGEHNAGLIFEGGEPKHWLVLLPGEAESVTWADAKAFAKKAGGELPTRAEQSLLFANLKAEFQPRWYWSGEQRAGERAYAWIQDFSDGDQGWSRQDDVCRARAVRRISI